jgi:hypothetical protein
LVGAGLLLVAPRPATAVPATHAAAFADAQPTRSADGAATWLSRQVTSDGFIESTITPGQPDLGTTAQAVLALAAVGQGGTQVAAMDTYLAGHVDDYVKVGGSDGPGQLGFLILDAVATGQDPTSFGGTNLVARLTATERPNGLFGSQDATYDGAFRQGTALLALAAAGTTTDSGANNWLLDQQCDDGSWTSFRADTSVPCPPVDPSTFTGPDTNSTALAALGLAAQAVTPTNDPVPWFNNVRTADGGWSYLGDPTGITDADSTGLSMAALRVLTGAMDTDGEAALSRLQVDCTGDPADQGGIAFEADPKGLLPNGLATAQALFGLSDVPLPIVNATIAAGTTDPCAPVTTTSTTTSTTTATSTSTTEISEGPDGGDVTGETLPRTGPILDSGATEAWSAVGVGLMCVGIGLVLLARGRLRRV